MKNIALQYFEAFSNKDLAKVSEFFDQYVTLRDWEIVANGALEVLDATQRIFDAVDSIKVHPVNLVLDGGLIFAELEICINNLETINVVDVIEFSSHGKIRAIRAFKG